jgi:parallel beta-helix repeat protein
MKKLLIFCVALGFVFAISGLAQAGTIQDAINAASDGATINIPAGTYTETITVNKEVTLLGANHDVDPAGGLDRGGESVIVGQVTITADAATVNGFKLTSSYITAGYTSAQNVNISYNILENVVATWSAIHLHGNHQCDGAYVGYNTIINAQGDGIWTVGNDDVTIEYNHILDNTGERAIQALNHVGTGIVIHANTITNSGGKGINYWAEDGGEITDNVITNSKYEAIYTDAQATISGNQILGGDMYGILVVAWTSGTAADSTVSGNTISNTNWEGIQSDVQVTITNNDISGGYNGIQLSNAASGSVIDGNNIHDNRYWGLSILDSVTDAIVKNNQLSYNPYCGVIVWGDGEGSGIHINCNEITGNGIYGVESQRTTSNVDATQNWWGDASGPTHSTNSGGTGNAVSDNVDYDPWTPGYHSSGFEPPMSKGPVKVKKNRVLPLKAELLDVDGNPLTDVEILAPPVLQVMFKSGTASDALDVTDDALSAGHGTEGNEFVFDGVKWFYNLKTKNYSSSGTYTVTMVSGDECEYIIDPFFTASFVIE